jgi:hypothetical protein
MICKQQDFVSMNRTCEPRGDFETKNQEYPAMEEDFSLMLLHTHLGEQLSWVLIAHQRQRPPEIWAVMRFGQTTAKAVREIKLALQRQRK